ncbi:hypothetical protein Tco_1282185 [Tanacetum coccineum]
MKAFTTQSGVAYEGPSIPTNPEKVVERETEETTDKEQSNFQGSTAQIPPPITPISILEPDVPKTLPKTTPILESDLEAYSDSDYVGSHGDRKSTTGRCQFLGRRLISWQCKKQTIVATSSTEAEYVAAASCCAQVLKIHTDENVADLLTKAFDGPRFEYLVVHIGMVDMLFCGILFSCDCRSSMLLLVVILSAGRLVSAGCTMFLLVVILSAGRLVSAGRTMVLLVVILSAGRLVSAGRTMVLLVVILSAGRLVSAGCTMLLLVVILSAGRLVSAGCTMFLLVVILSAGRLVSAGRTMVLLVVILSAGCSVSAGSYGFCCCFRVHDGGHPSAGGFIYAVRVYVPAVCMVSAVG